MILYLHCLAIIAIVRAARVTVSEVFIAIDKNEVKRFYFEVDFADRPLAYQCIEFDSDGIVSDKITQSKKKKIKKAMNLMEEILAWLCRLDTPFYRVNLAHSVRNLTKDRPNASNCVEAKILKTIK